MQPTTSEFPCANCGFAGEPFVHPGGLLPGTILREHYLIGEVLGSGGFGITYIARDITLDRRVAIKEYYPSSIARRSGATNCEVTVVDPTTAIGDAQDIFTRGRDNFLSEARTLARFDKEPGIVGVLDFFIENNTAYIVMEYLEGTSLALHIRKNGPMSQTELVRCFNPVISALDKVHEAGVIHRDISPDNIMVLPDGKLVLMDFGAVRALENTAPVTALSKDGYSPVEQYSSAAKLGAWTDIYALGATWYFCLTGKIPLSSVARSVDDTLEIPSVVGADTSPGFESTLRTMLALNPDSRYQSIHDLEVAVPQIANVETPRPQTTARTSNRTDDVRIPKKKSQPLLTRREALIGAATATIAGAGLLFNSEFGVNNAVDKTNDSTGIHVHLSSASQTTVDDYYTARDLLLERLELLFGPKGYSYEELDGAIKLLLPNSPFPQDHTVPTMIHRYLAAANYLYLIQADENNGEIYIPSYDSILYTPKNQIENVALFEGPSEYIDYTKENAEEGHHYLRVTLSQDYVAENKNFIEKAGDNLAFVFNTCAKSLAWGSWAHPVGDGRSFDVVTHASKELADFEASMFTREPYPESFIGTTSFIDGLSWDRESGLVEGDFYAMHFYFESDGSTDGQQLDFVQALANRLDIIGEPYAISMADNDPKHSVYVKTSLTRQGWCIATLLKSLKSDFKIVFTPTFFRVISYDIESVKVSNTPAGESVLEISIDLTKAYFLEELTDTVLLSAESENSRVFLYVDEQPLLSAPIPQIDGDIYTLVFDEVIPDVSDDTSWFFDLIDHVYHDSLISNSITLQNALILTDTGDFSLASFPISYLDIANSAAEKICELSPRAASWIENGTLYVLLYLDVGTSFPEESLKLVQEIYEAIDFDNNAIYRCIIILSRERERDGERARIWFYKSSTKRFYGLIANGRYRDMSHAFIELLSNNPFFSYAGSEYTWIWTWP